MFLGGNTRRRGERGPSRWDHAQHLSHRYRQRVGRYVSAILEPSGLGMRQNLPKNGEKAVGSRREVQRDGPAVVQIHSAGRETCWFKLLPVLTRTLLYCGSHIQRHV